MHAVHPQHSPGTKNNCIISLSYLMSRLLNYFSFYSSSWNSWHNELVSNEKEKIESE
jgi:hypothetical protein